MAEITASAVKELREKTGAGMMDCKKALTEANGDLETAVDWLRKKGLAAAAKKAGRIAAEGLVGVAVKNNVGAIVEVNSETDFVAMNDIFQSFVKDTAQLALDEGDTQKLAELNYQGKALKDALTELIAKIGENLSLRRSKKLSVNKGSVTAYMHNQISSGLGKIGVLVALSSDADKDELDVLGKQIAMHIAASNPLFLNVESVSHDALDREKNVLFEQARASGKPDNIIEKMMEGRIRKYYEQVCLLEQPFIMDPDKSVGKVIEEAAKKLGASIKLTDYVRFALGEGIEKEEKDFAAEVAAAANI